MARTLGMNKGGQTVTRAWFQVKCDNVSALLYGIDDGIAGAL